MFLLSLVQRSTPWLWQGVACICCCYAVKLVLHCRCFAEHRQAQALISSSPGSHLIQDRLQDCFICRALHLLTSWINVQDVLSNAGSTIYEDEHAVLVLVLAIFLLAQ